MGITIEEARITKFDPEQLGVQYPDEEEYFGLVDSQASDLSQGSKDLLKEIHRDQSHGEYMVFPLELELTKAQKGHLTDLKTKGYITVNSGYDEDAECYITWICILLNGRERN